MHAHVHTHLPAALSIASGVLRAERLAVRILNYESSVISFTSYEVKSHLGSEKAEVLAVWTSTENMLIDARIPATQMAKLPVHTRTRF